MDATDVGAAFARVTGNGSRRLGWTFSALVCVCRDGTPYSLHSSPCGERGVDDISPTGKDVEQGFAWGQPVADLLVNECLSCPWARDDNRTYIKMDDDGVSLYRQRSSTHGGIICPRPTRSTGGVRLVARAPFRCFLIGRGCPTRCAG